MSFQHRHRVPLSHVGCPDDAQQEGHPSLLVRVDRIVASETERDEVGLFVLSALGPVHDVMQVQSGIDSTEPTTPSVTFHNRFPHMYRYVGFAWLRRLPGRSGGILREVPLSLSAGALTGTELLHRTTRPHRFHREPILAAATLKLSHKASWQQRSNPVLVPQGTCPVRQSAASST